MVPTNDALPTIEQLAEEFLQRYRRGERPALAEYTGRHPALAEEIREVFAALVLVEAAGPPPKGPPAAYSGRITADGKSPQRLGDYRILREVGRGGMGVVYEAVQEALGRHVALKVLPYEAAADLTCLKRFTREARAAARLHHTNIAPVYDIGEHQGVHYYAMQFIQGQGLDDVLVELRRMQPGKEHLSPTYNLTQCLAAAVRSGRFAAPPAEKEGGAAPAAVATPDVAAPLNGAVDPFADGNASAVSSFVLNGHSDLTTETHAQYYRSVAHLGLQVAEALAYSHSQKILHRDIKPSNLLLDLHGTVWVTDFGLAKEEGDDLTHVGDVVGTLRYMPPERFNGISDARGDLYSLGLTLYELLTLCARRSRSATGVC